MIVVLAVFLTVRDWVKEKQRLGSLTQLTSITSDFDNPQFAYGTATMAMGGIVSRYPKVSYVDPISEGAIGIRMDGRGGDIFQMPPSKIRIKRISLSHSSEGR